MMTPNELVAGLIELAKETESTNPIDWEALNLNRDAIYSYLATQTVEYYINNISELKKDEQIIVLLSSVLHLSLQVLIDTYMKAKNEQEDN